MLYNFTKFFFTIIFKFFFGLEIKGKENFPQKKSFILASNHLSYLDPIILGVASPVRLYFLAKEELFKNKFFAFLIRNLGAIPLKRNYAHFSALKEAIDILKRKPLVIFPQSTRTHSFEIFKEGVAFLYKKTKLPIVVAKIENSDKVLGKNSFFPKLAKIKVSFQILKNIENEESRSEITKKVIEAMKELSF